MMNSKAIRSQLQSDNSELRGIEQIDYIPKSAVCHFSLATTALPCDSYHHYYHYQASAQYLWLAQALVATGRLEEAEHAYEKAIFQDHFNNEALAKNKGSAYIPSYGKHPNFDAVFCASVGQPTSPFTALHDEAAEAYLAGYYEHALTLLAESTEHSNSFFLAGKCLFMLGEYENAISALCEALRLSHIAHDEYHLFASEQHRLRGEQFFSAGEMELAISDFTKALDLDKTNKGARKARAAAYRAKGNSKLAQEDERLAS